MTGKRLGRPDRPEAGELWEVSLPRPDGSWEPLPGFLGSRREAIDVAKATFAADGEGRVSLVNRVAP